MNERWLEDRDDEISKLFRDNEEQLEETPSFRTWDRVERKLDRRRGQKRKVMYRYTSMIAASIAIFAMIYIIGFLDRVSFDGGMANKTKTIENTSSGEQNVSDKEVAVLEEQAEYKTIDENNFPRLENKPFEQSKEEPIASNFNNLTNDIEEFTAISPKIAETNDAKKVNEDIPLTSKPSKRIETPPFDWSEPVEEEAEEVMEEDITVYDDAITTYNEKEKADKITLNSQGNPNPKQKDEGKSSEEEILVSSRAYNNKETSKARIGKYKKASDVPQKTYNVNQFNWLMGDWRDVSIGGSYENWQIGKNELNGSGYVIIGADTSFVEQMRIYQRGKDIYFEGPVDASQKIRKFRLESYAGNEAIFNRKGKNFPNQVIITRHTNNSYSIVYQNKDAIKIDSTEQLYFKYRNRLNSQRASRNMTRY